jgi:hypothetical protein
MEHKTLRVIELKRRELSFCTLGFLDARGEEWEPMGEKGRIATLFGMSWQGCVCPPTAMRQRGVHHGPDT